MITLYSTGCPRCNVLTKKLNATNISFNEVNDVDVIASKGIDTVPVLEVDGQLMDFKTANDWINSQED